MSEQSLTSSIVDSEAIVCKNCKLAFQGSYCPNCGQKFIASRFTLAESTSWIFDKLFNLEKGIFFTIKKLFQQPHHMVSQYLNRNTVNYMHPFRFVFLLATISSLLTIICGTFESDEMLRGMKDFIEGYNSVDGGSKVSMEDLLLTVETIKKYLAFILILNIPINSLATKIIYFNKKYNFTEHLILNCYAYGASLVIGLPLYLVMVMENGFSIYQLFNTLLYFSTYLYIFNRFFKENVFITIVKLMGIFILSGLFSAILVFLLIGVFVFKTKFGL